MEYNLQIQLSFEQLLKMILQLPAIEKKQLIAAIIQDNEPNNDIKATIQTKTIKELLAKDYQYPAKNSQLLVGAWDTNEPIEMLLNLKTK